MIGYILVIITSVIQCQAVEETPLPIYLGFRVSTTNSESIDFFRKLDDQQNEDLVVAQLPTLDRPASVVVASSYREKFEELMRISNLDYELTLEDVIEYLEKQRNIYRHSEKFDFENFHDIDKIYEWLYELEESYPGTATVVVAGETYEGRNITGIRICTPSSPGTQKPIFVIESGIHAREWVAPSTAAFIIDQLLTNESDVFQELTDAYEWHIFPSINPDGYQYTHQKTGLNRYWRKNMAFKNTTRNGCFGVDLNRNWDYNWKNGYSISRNMCAATYGGKRPFSEVETDSFQRYLRGLGEVRVYVALHSYSRLMLLPYSDSVQRRDNFNDMMRIGSMALRYLWDVNGTVYRIGTAAQILYRASGGSFDWVKKNLRVPISWCYELDGDGGGFAPAPATIRPQGREIANSLLGMHYMAKKLGYVKPIETVSFI